MKVKVRRGVFETNSSSSHSLCICTQMEYDEWKKGNLVYDDYDECLVPIDSLDEEELADFNSGESDQYFDLERYHDYICEEDETFEQTFTSPSGDSMIAFGHYGYH